MWGFGGVGVLGVWGGGGRFEGEGLFPGGEASATRAGIVELLARVRRRLGGLDVPPRTDAGIDKRCAWRPRAQIVESRAVDRLARALDVFLVPVEPQPLQILDRLRRSAGLVLRMVEILHAEDDPSAPRPRAQPRDHERPHVPEMQGTRRTRRQTPRETTPAHLVRPPGHAVGRSDGRIT